MSDLDAAYRQLLEELFAARRAGVVFGLERMHAVLAKLGHPERRLGTIVHVGGTNGKGSTVAMIAAMLRAHGETVAQYTSPHLTTVRERVRFDGEPISREAFVAAAQAVRAAGGATLTFFEQLTALAMVAIADRHPTATVLEVGLGGRLDATNVVESEVALVTGVAFDHQAMLGHTLAEIAVEKAGIFRAARPAIIGVSGEPAGVPVLLAQAQARGAAPITVISEGDLAAVPPLALAGAHQRRNAAAALAVIRSLVASGRLPEDEAAQRRGLLAAQHPGRCETVARAPLVILDGAHNPHGAAALALEAAQLPAPRVLILAVSSDKDVAAMVAALLPAFTAVVATAYRQQRALPAATLARAVEQAWPPGAAAAVHVADEIDAALTVARPLAGAGGSIVVAGSLFLVGEARALLVGGDVDPLRLSDPAGGAPPPAP
jgi:dihydrofolate synthase / folylpolyglutamate synthase